MQLHLPGPLARVVQDPQQKPWGQWPHYQALALWPTQLLASAVDCLEQRLEAQEEEEEAKQALQQ